jgi:arabinogalactan endo-1,4-beta-galactosidase
MIPLAKICFAIVALSLFFSCNDKNTSDPPVTPVKKNYQWNEFAMGADLSFVNQVEDYGGVYKDSGKVKDLFQVMKNHGANTVRVRIWHNPRWVGALNGGKMYYDLMGTEKTIQRAKAAGMAVNLDFHYSDTWADPGNQEPPAAWKDLPLNTLSDSIYNYTLQVLNYLQSKDLVPEMVQVGNETNNGMIWPSGKVTGNNFAAFSQLLNAGIRAVRNFSATSTIKPKIILHVAQMDNADYWAKGITSKGVTDFDIFGLSHYTKWSNVKTMQGVTDSIRQFISRYGKTVMVVETAYPFTGDNADNYNNIFSPADSAQGYGVSKDGQYKYLKDLTQAIIAGGGKGIMYWEPAWISSRLNDGWGTGSSWENNALFDFNGNALPAIDYMNYTYKF